MNCLEEPGCTCNVCEQREIKYRTQKLQKKKKKEEDDFIHDCIKKNKTHVKSQKRNTLCIIQTIYVAKYKDIMLSIGPEYLRSMKSYKVKENLLELSNEISFYSGIFGRLDMLHTQFSNKRVKKDSHSIVLPYSLCFHLKDKASEYVTEWCNTISYLHTYNVLPEKDGIFTLTISSDNKLTFTRV